MTVKDLIYNYYTDESFKKDIDESFEKAESIYDKEELENHYNNICYLDKSFILNKIFNEVYEVDLKVEL